MGDMSICRADKLRCETPNMCEFVCQREKDASTRRRLDTYRGAPLAATPALDPRNPKDIAGQAKPQLHLIPSPALIEVAKVMGNGAFKYGPYNWREKPVCHTAYISAAERHTRSHLDGELMDPDAAKSSPEKGAPPNPDVYHLAAAAAGLLILLDAILTGNAVDDRPKPGVAGALINPPALAPFTWVNRFAEPSAKDPDCRCPAHCQKHSAIRFTGA